MTREMVYDNVFLGLPLFPQSLVISLPVSRYSPLSSRCNLQSGTTRDCRSSRYLPPFSYEGIDTLACVEAVISHLVVRECQILCAHAPAMLPVPLSQSLSPSSPAEEVEADEFGYMLADILK